MYFVVYCAAICMVNKRFSKQWQDGRIKKKLERDMHRNFVRITGEAIHAPRCLGRGKALGWYNLEYYIVYTPVYWSRSVARSLFLPVISGRVIDRRAAALGSNPRQSGQIDMSGLTVRWPRNDEINLSRISKTVWTLRCMVSYSRRLSRTRPCQVDLSMDALRN